MINEIQKKLEIIIQNLSVRRKHIVSDKMCTTYAPNVSASNVLITNAKRIACKHGGASLGTFMHVF